MVPPAETEPVRVLLVDDNKAILARATQVLTPQYEVVGVVSSGAEALKAVGALRPNVVVLDISMPTMNGFEVASVLRRAGCEAAFIFLTVHEEEDFVAAAQAAGAIGYVVKGRLASDLPIAIGAACAGRPFVSPLH